MIEPHGSPQGCSVRPRKGTGQSSMGGIWRFRDIAPPPPSFLLLQQMLPKKNTGGPLPLAAASPAIKKKGTHTSLL